MQALGLEAPTVPVPPAAWPALGLAGAASVRGISMGGADPGFGTILVELGGDPASAEIAHLARRIRSQNPVRLQLLVFAGARYRCLTLASFGLDGELRQLTIERSVPRATDIEALEEMVARDGEGGVALALRHARALERSRLTRQFFRDFRTHRARVADAWTGLPSELVAEREQLALLLLSRLMFLYFLQRQGALAGDASYMAGLLRGWRRAPGGETFFRAKLRPLFFGALNTRPATRDAAALALGSLPFLNGGLFERHALERRFPALDLADDALVRVFDELLERYRFTGREAAEGLADGVAEMGVDPEMLGQVFEGLMAAERRGATGTFYTPAAVVDRLVAQSLEAYLTGAGRISASAAAALVRQGYTRELGPQQRQETARRMASLRVLDPACGSGAFLLGALLRLSRVRSALGQPRATGREPLLLREVRRDVVGRSLYGVDLQEDAALLCALRLWLALAEGAAVRGPGGKAAPHRVPPLPNLDRRIRQGDVLLDPLDLATAGESTPSPWRGAAMDANVRRALAQLAPLAQGYLAAEPEERPALQRRLIEAEAGLAVAWLDALQSRAAGELRELSAQASTRDLFGERPPAARRAEAQFRLTRERNAELDRIRKDLDDGGALPFFSFGVHFAEVAQAGFDLILSNPPWVRAHRWPPAVSRLVRRRYAVCRSGGWRAGADMARAPAGVAGQIDLALLFLERAIQLLAPRGVLAMLLPAKAMRSLYGGGGRRLLLEATELVSIEDHSLDQRSIFRADAFAAAIIARKRTSPDPPVDARPSPVRVSMVRRAVAPLEFTVSPDDLPLHPDDPTSPWLLAPPDVHATLRRMQAAGPPVGRRLGLRVRRGVMTGANDVMILRDVEPKLGGLAWVRAEGYHRARKQGDSARAARRFASLVEASAVRPLVRGSDISAWSFRISNHVVWLHDDASAARIGPPAHIAAYLERHQEAWSAANGAAAGRQGGFLFRLSSDTLRHKVAWHDLASNLNAVALPATVPLQTGGPGPLIPLNTVYFIGTTDQATALLLAAYFNSLPVRTFALGPIR